MYSLVRSTIMRSNHDELKGEQDLTVVFAQNLDTFHFPGRTLRHLSGRGIPASRNHIRVIVQKTKDTVLNYAIGVRMRQIQDQTE